MTTANKSSRALNIGLWIVQVLLGLSFSMAGFMKMTAPVSELVTQMQWAGDIPEWTLRFIGVAELAGGIGILVPALTKIKPFLSAWAAWGLALVMALAAGFHVVRGEWPDIITNLVLLAMAVFVGWGRTKKAPIG